MGLTLLLLVLLYLRRTCLRRLSAKKVLAKEGELAGETEEEIEAREALEAAKEVRLCAFSFMVQASGFSV